MLDIKFIRENPDVVREAMRLKGDEANLDRFLKLDNNRRAILKDVEELKYQRNRVSREIGNRKARGVKRPKIKLRKCAGLQTGSERWMMNCACLTKRWSRYSCISPQHPC